MRRITIGLRSESRKLLTNKKAGAGSVGGDMHRLFRLLQRLKEFFLIHIDHFSKESFIDGEQHDLL